MDFKTPYLLAMREQAPGMFKELVRSGKMEEHLQAKSEEAHSMLQRLLASVPKDPYGQPQMELARAAEEIVRATLIDFPTPDALPAPLPTWNLLRDLGFRPDYGVSIIKDSLSFDFGGFQLSANKTLNRHFVEVIFLSGILATHRPSGGLQTLGEVEFEMPIEIQSRAQCAAWIAWHLDKDWDRNFIPTYGVDWIVEGRQHLDLLPWLARAAAYAARPRCLVQRDWLRLALKTLSEKIETASDDDTVAVDFRDGALSFRCGEKVIALPAEGTSWPGGFLIPAGKLRNLPKRLLGWVSEVSIYKSQFTIGRHSYTGIMPNPTPGSAHG
jgi:hypothetical protein